MLSCKKHSNVSDSKSFPIVDNQDEANINNVQPQTDSSCVDNECCLTELLITSLTLRCYYCRDGFLYTVASTNKYVCFSCGIMIPDLSCVVKSIIDKEQDFESWNEKFRNNDQKYLYLEMMEQIFNQLTNLLSAYDVRLLVYATKIARAFHSINEIRKSIYYCRYALRILSFYCLEFVLCNEREKFNKIWNELQSLHEHLIVFEESENYHLYLEDFQRFKMKLDEKGSITGEPIINVSLTGDADDFKK
ncbi:hypothetical protein DERP_007729 [Dermatophagoides pteronyssinus]|uniref:Uncharacterized protein n=1 Tax=Dermatophagoides pteronyssinus TaxID=6956 RepID=A0ABQ8JL46_DERPT|nr:hypothetical protein DERP_007729 [Dermatophagoides pteronyssinus]